MTATNDFAAARAPATTKFGESRAADRAGERNNFEHNDEIPGSFDRTQ
jgi:hypothetical protein